MPSGDIFVDNQIKPFGLLPSLARIGFDFTLSKQYENITWYGRGPHENYSDRKTSAAVGLYRSTVDEQFVNYVLPQGNGNREEVRWTLFSNSFGNGMLLTHRDKSFSMKALHYREKQLEDAQHRNELKKDDAIFLTISESERGIGNASLGPELFAEYEVPAEPVSFSYSLRPFDSSRGKPQELSRIKLPVISSSLIKRDKFGQVSISTSSNESEIYYSLDNTAPSRQSNKYVAPFIQILPVKIRSIAYEKENSSSISELHVDQLKLLKPEINPSGIHFDKKLSVTINSPMEGTEIRYTIDGSTPTEKSLLYNGPIEVNNTSTLKVRTFKNNHIPSEINIADYELLNIKKGVNFRYYVGRWGSTPDYLKLKPDSFGVISQFNLDEIENEESHYALLMFAEIITEKEGEYTFYSGSNDGTKLYINSELIIDNDGGHGYHEKSESVYLERGKHLIEVRYFQQGGGQELKISWEGPGFEKREMTVKDISG